MQATNKVVKLLELQTGWVDSERLQVCLQGADDFFSPRFAVWHITVPKGCKFMVDAGVVLLSLVNQLASAGKTVSINFADGEPGTMGYLDRLGFFQWLHPSISVTPDRPVQSRHQIFSGSNRNVVEFIPISPDKGKKDRDVPPMLANRLEEACRKREDHERLGMAAFTLFGELIDNIYQHSETEVDGYAALQVYANAGKVIVSVSDSGRGILETLRESVPGEAVKQMSDPELIVHLFNTGLSRFGPERGCGLRQCADHALKYNAEVFLRLPTSSLHLVPSGRSYVHSHKDKNMVYGNTGLSLIKGTHITFSFKLDNT